MNAVPWKASIGQMVTLLNASEKIRELRNDIGLSDLSNREVINKFGNNQLTRQRQKPCCNELIRE